MKSEVRKRVMNQMRMLVAADHDDEALEWLRQIIAELDLTFSEKVSTWLDVTRSAAEDPRNPEQALVRAARARVMRLQQHDRFLG